jgi:hypothetical protein
VERVASASVPDVTQTDFTDTTMPVALARRAEDDTGTQVPQPRAHCDALQPAHLTAHKSQISAPHLCSACSLLQTAERYPARALSHTPGLAASQPRGSAFKASQQPTKQAPDDDDGRHAESVQ